MGPVARLAVDAGGLFFGVPSWRRGPRLRFKPGGAELHASNKVRQLEWDHVVDPGRAIAGLSPSVTIDHWAITGPGRHQPTAVTFGGNEYRVGRLATGMGLGMSAAGAASSLCEYLRDVEAARANLANNQVTESVVQRLAGRNWLARSREPFAGARLDVQRHLLGALQVLGVHCYRWRFVEGEVPPPVEEVVEVVRSGLPPWVHGRASTPEAIARRYERILAAKPWPFGTLAL